MKPASSHILTINESSSSFTFALFEAAKRLRRPLDGRIERIGLPGAAFSVNGSEKFSRALAVPNQTVTVNGLDGLAREKQQR